MTPADYLVWLISLSAPIYIIVCLVARRELPRYFALAFYCLATSAVSIGSFATLKAYGITSKEYAYVYYYGESVLAILLFLVVLGLFRHLLEDMGAALYVRVAGVLLRGGTAWISFMIVQGNRGHT